MKLLAIIVIIVLAIGGLWWLGFGPGHNGAPNDTPEVVDLGSRVPNFDDFRVEEVFKGKSAAVDFRTKPAAQEFKSRLTKGAAEGPNFADKYTLVSWGCGTECQMSAIVDAETGVIVEFGILSRFEIKVRRDSALLVINPLDSYPRNQDLTGIDTQYYIMEGGRLRYLAKASPTGDLLDCALLVTRAKNEATGEEQGFARFCQAPEDWTITSVEIPGL